MLKGIEIKVGKDLDYNATVKELKGQFNPPEAPTDDAVGRCTTSLTTVQSGGVIYNKNRENLEIYREIYQQDSGGNTKEEARGYENNEDLLKRNFRKKFRELADKLTGTKIQSLFQLGELEALEKEVELV